MPGNGVGDRVHNFFDQDNLSQSQHHSQVVEGNWPVLSNNLWTGNQTQTGAPLISGIKNYNVQQSDPERGVASQSMRVPHGLNFTQSTVRPEFAKSQSQNQQSNLNGYMHGHHLFQTRQNEANLLGVGRVPDRHNLVSRGLYSPETPQRNGPENGKDTMSLEADDSPINYDFLGGQPQMSNQQQAMLQSLPRQHSGFSDVQLLQQQAVIRQMQELQRHQQIQQQEVRHQNSITHIPSIAKQAGSNHSPVLINGTPIHDGSNYAWNHEPIAGNTNWLQRGALPVMQGSSNGPMCSPEQGQGLRMMSLSPQGVDQSLYGFPISNTRGTSTQYSHDNIDRSTMQHLSTSNNSFAGHQYAAQVSMQDGASVSRQGFDAENMFGHSPGQGLGSRVVTEYSQQVNAQPRIASVQEFQRRQEIADSSGTLPEKTMVPVASSQSVVPLDPTEEKFLFGTDDNIWDAFGKTTNVGPDGYNLLDGSDVQNAFPSMQSGSWSALMQSAVAETSGGDTGIQNEWSGLTFPNSELPSGTHQPSVFNGSGKHQTIWADNNLQTAASSVPRPFLLSEDANKITNYSTVPGFQQSEMKSFGKSDKFLSMSSDRSIQQSSEEGSKWKDHSPLQKPLAEGNETYGNESHSSDAELRAKGISGSWTHQESTCSYNTGSQPFNKPNGWNFMGTMASGGDAMLKLSEAENSLHRSQSNEHETVMHQEMSQAAVARKGSLVPDLSVELERGKPDIGTPPVNRGDSNLNNITTIRNLSTTKGDQDAGQQFSANHHIEYLKHVEVPSNSKGGEGFGNYQHHLKNSVQVLESSVNSSDKGVVEMHDMDNSNKKENSSDSHRSKSSHHASSGGLGENVWLDANEARSLAGGKHKSSCQIGRKSSGSRKFQYHPMGNLDEDVEPYYGTKLGTLSQATSQLGTRGLNSHDQGSSVHSNFVGHVRRNSKEVEKGRSLESQVDGKGVDEVPSRSNFPGHVPNVSAPFDRPIGIYAPIKTAQSSQNMLELLHKVDQSREHGGMTHISSSDHTLPSEMPEGETSNRFDGHLQRKHSSAFQGFGLQLAPPSQRLPVPKRASSSQSSSHTANSLNSSQAIPETGDGSRMWVAPTAMLPSRETPEGEFQNNNPDIQGQNNSEASPNNVQGNFSAASASCFPYSKSQHQNQLITGSRGQLTTDQSAIKTFNTLDSSDRTLTGPSVPVSLPETAGSSPHNNFVFTADMSNTNKSKVPTKQLPVLDSEPVSDPVLKPGMSQQGAFSAVLPNARTNISTQQRLLGAQAHQASSSLFDSHLQSNNNVETTPSTLQKGGDVSQRGNGPFESGACSMSSQGFVQMTPGKESPWQQVSPDNIDLLQKATSASQGKESVVNHHSDASVPKAAATQRDIEAFGRSLKPDSKLHRNYSLLHQMQAMKSIETDPSDRNLKRFKGTDCGPNGQQSSYEFNTMVRDASMNRSQLQTGDSNMLSFSSEPGNNRDKSQLGNIPSQDMLAYGRNNSPNELTGNDAVSGKSEQINPRMAPSWFNQFGTFKNGKIFPMYDAQKAATLNSVEQQYTFEKSADGMHALSQTDQADVAAETSQVIDVRQSSTPIAIGSEHFSSPHSLLPAVSDQSLVVLRPKKRKSATSGLLPWHKEVSQGSQKLLTISMAEVAWAEAANRLVEKVEDEAEMMIDDGPLMLRPKRRLILTTQLMQQLIHPPPASVLIADSRSNYENVAYFVARSSLGDACSQLSRSGSDSLMPLDSRNLLAETLKTSNRMGEEYYLKVVEDFIGRAKRLEADLLKSDKKTSILDLRVECQDLEKFSVINRFAKFHGRGQADGAESSSSSDATINNQKTFPQRYVTALPMPRNLPDRALQSVFAPALVLYTNKSPSTCLSSYQAPAGPPSISQHLENKVSSYYEAPEAAK